MLESGARSKKDKVNWSHAPLNPNCSLKYYIPKAQLMSLITFTCGSFTIARVCICSSAVYWSNPRLMKAEGNSGPTCVSGLSYHLWGLKAVFIALLGHLSFVGFKRFFAGAWLCLVVLTSDLPIWCWHLWVSFLYPCHMGSRVCHWCQDSISYNIRNLHVASRQAAKKKGDVARMSMPSGAIGVSHLVSHFWRPGKCEFGQLKGTITQLCSTTLLGLASLHLFERLTAWFMDKGASVFLPLWALGMGTWKWRLLAWNHFLERY